MTRADRFSNLVRAEWTKFRSVRRWVLGMASAAILTVLLSALAAAGSSTDVSTVPAFVDVFSFVHQPLTGDGSVTALVSQQQNSHEWAKAGVIVKAGTGNGAPYAAVLLTPGHGVRLQANFGAADIAGSRSTAPRWLRLTRAGDELTGYESADGITWTRIGTVRVALPETAAAGLLVTSPSQVRIERTFGGNSRVGVATIGNATFANATVANATVSPTAPGAQWQHVNVGRAPAGEDPLAGPNAPAPPGTVTGADGNFTVTGSGDVARLTAGDDDIVKNALGGVMVGLMAVVALAVLYITAEYRRGMIRTTFAASPRRGRVLVAKALVIGTVTFVAGLVASVAAFFLTQPILRDNGYVPPHYPTPSLGDEPVLRAVVGTAVFLAVLAVFSLAVGTVLRRSAGAITLVIASIIVPAIVAEALPLEPAMWLERLTPVAGLAIQQTRLRFDTAIGPYAGLAVLCGYAAVAFVAALWVVRRRDA